VKQFLNFTEGEGLPATLNICGNYLTIGSSEGVIKVFDLSRRLESCLHMFLSVNQYSHLTCCATYSRITQTILEK